MSNNQLAKYVISELRGIAPEDLTTAERKILARAEQSLIPERITDEEHASEHVTGMFPE